ncbi:4-demethylwyosine synthase TYW1 [Candidatus Parvarchaeota archaeon]|nr:4-demethylwyosine synthase TYW1 [Candidatus Parvarchaeota archaeon]
MKIMLEKSDNPTLDLSENPAHAPTSAPSIADKMAAQMVKKQQSAGYYFVGSNMHAAVKVCMWTKKSIRGEAACYKASFYGIKSHRCVQMSPAVPYCNHSCIHCWRDTSAHYSGWHGGTDPPDIIASESIMAQIKLLNGFPGSAKTDMAKHRESSDPIHVAISLDGEPTLYAHLPRLIREYHARGLTTFLVSNGSNPQVLERLEQQGAMPTQLYLSFNSPTKEEYKKIVVPLIPDAWEKYCRSLDYLARVGKGEVDKAMTRTVLRMTLALNHNMHGIEGYATFIKHAKPHYVEVKAYMALGSSRNRLGPSRMPTHAQIKEFAASLAKESGYITTAQHALSRIVLLCRDEDAVKSRILKVSRNGGIKTSKEAIPIIEEQARQAIQAGKSGQRANHRPACGS